MTPAIARECLIADMRKTIEPLPDLADYAAVAETLRAAGYSADIIDVYAAAVITIERVRRQVMHGCIDVRLRMARAL